MARRVVSVRVFNPESEAEPPGFEDAGAQELGPPGGGAADGEGAAPPQPAAEQPSVLNKLQKWVRRALQLAVLAVWAICGLTHLLNDLAQSTAT